MESLHPRLCFQTNKQTIRAGVPAAISGKQERGDAAAALRLNRGGGGSTFASGADDKLSPRARERVTGPKLGADVSPGVPSWGCCHFLSFPQLLSPMATPPNGRCLI